jgi:hypothetical protein
MPSPSRDTQQIEHARAFVFDMLDRTATYHQHKESAAYAGITLFAGIAGAAATSSSWPPHWAHHTQILAVSLATLLWIAVLVFLRFQLTRRRWAALRVAACERLLADWVQKEPSDKELATSTSNARPPIDCCSCVANSLWGSKKAVRAVNTEESVYPRALVDKLLAQEERGTDALKHERLILLSGWALYIVLVAATLLR